MGATPDSSRGRALRSSTAEPFKRIERAPRLQPGATASAETHRSQPSLNPGRATVPGIRPPPPRRPRGASAPRPHRRPRRLGPFDRRDFRASCTCEPGAPRRDCSNRSSLERESLHVHRPEAAVSPAQAPAGSDRPDIGASRRRDLPAPPVAAAHQLCFLRKGSTMREKRGYSYAEAMAYLGLKRRAFDRHIRPRLPSPIQCGTTHIFDRADLDRAWDEYCAGRAEARHERNAR